MCLDRHPHATVGRCSDVMVHVGADKSTDQLDRFKKIEKSYEEDEELSELLTNMRANVRAHVVCVADSALRR
jgi:hypothetical protein